MANKLYIARETPISFDGTGGADVAFSMEGVVDGAGRVSAQYDLGTGSTPHLFRWRSEVLWQATPTKGAACWFYAAGGDGTNIDGDVGAIDAALGSEDQLSNLLYIGRVVVETAHTFKMVRSGTFEFYDRYISIVGFNRGVATINATDSNFSFELTPIPPEIQ